MTPDWPSNNVVFSMRDPTAWDINPTIIWWFNTKKKKMWLFGESGWELY